MESTDNPLEKQISKDLKQLRNLMSSKSTESVAGWCFCYLLGLSKDKEGVEQLTSPAKQIPFLMGVLLSSPEPAQAEDFDSDDWGRAKALLESLFSAYMHLYMPSEEDLGRLAPEWHRTREVSMLAFLHYFNSGLLASREQIVDRITRYLVPFDAELEIRLGISASEQISICQWIAQRLQQALDEIKNAAEVEHAHRIRLIEEAKAKNWSVDDFRKANKESSYGGKAEQLLACINAIGGISITELQAAFPDSSTAFLNAFAVRRGDGLEIRYPTGQSIFEERPLIQVSDSRILCPSIGALFNAPLFKGEMSLTQSEARDRYFRARDRALEREAVEALRPVLSERARIWTNLFETAECQYEHDIIAVDGGLCLVMEAKASPPIEPLRDPERAFVRLKDAFRGDTGIQKAHEQSDRILSQLRSGRGVTLFDGTGNEVTRLMPDELTVSIGICLTRDNFGGLATNLNLLLEKDADTPYPWVVNSLDLANIGEAWKYFGWGPVEFREFLEQRILLHGKVFSDDELDYVGYFIRHGSFGEAMTTEADLFHLNPEYSGIFDEIYNHLHCGGPAVTVTEVAPVLMDLRSSLAAGRPVLVENTESARSSTKVGRNEPCPCGSGKKYKRCCGRGD